MAKTKGKKVVYLDVIDVDGDKQRIDVNSITGIFGGKYEVKKFLKKNDIFLDEEIYDGTWINFNYNHHEDFEESVFVKRPVEDVRKEFLKLMKVTEKDIKRICIGDISKIAKVESFSDIPTCKFIKA